MKGNPQIIDKLNFLLADELTAISQYMVHAEMADDWGYAELAKVIEKRAIDEMKHAEKHIGRILFLEGLPIVSNLNPMHIGATIEKGLNNDHTAEEVAILEYNKAIALASELKDHGTRDMLVQILNDEEAHIDWIEAQIEQIEQMGLQTYLAQQIKQ